MHAAAGSQVEPMVPGSDTAKTAESRLATVKTTASGGGGCKPAETEWNAVKAAGGLHDVARNEPLRKAGSPATAVLARASEHGRDGCGWLLFEYRRRRQAPDTSSRRDGAVDCGTDRVPLLFAPALGGRMGLVVGVLFDICYLSPIPGSDRAKGVAGGLHDVARNEPLRKAGSLATAVLARASEHGCDGCGWLLFEYRRQAASARHKQPA